VIRRLLTRSLADDALASTFALMRRASWIKSSIFLPFLLLVYSVSLVGLFIAELVLFG
jgi:hypothetical protein